ncbi:unnamed protein product, partial [Mesorhabditis belari]|uniref:Neurotransmitter-gated ion-channel ligand-binding domain-containing protein n=1 Tax=Mesorhabditis belari TaxID=2138241 RepID=A0AAF3FMB4_9BILA
MAVTLQLLYIIDLDASSQVLRAYMVMDLVWQDPRLVWEPEEFDGRSAIVVQCDSLWIPDDFVINAIAIDQVAPERF